MRVVNAGLNDGGGYQNVNLVLLESEHDVFYLTSTHLAVSHTHASFRRSLLHASHRFINSGHAVGHVVHLSFSLQLTPNSCGNKIWVVLAHHYLNRLSARRRRQNQAHVTNSAHGHLHGARNWRCRERQHIYLLAHVFELLFVLHTKALFLVNDNQAQVVWIDVS